MWVPWTWCFSKSTKFWKTDARSEKKFLTKKCAELSTTQWLSKMLVHSFSLGCEGNIAWWYITFGWHLSDIWCIIFSVSVKFGLQNFVVCFLRYRLTISDVSQKLCTNSAIKRYHKNDTMVPWTCPKDECYFEWKNRSSVRDLFTNILWHGKSPDFAFCFC